MSLIAERQAIAEETKEHPLICEIVDEVIIIPVVALLKATLGTKKKRSISFLQAVAGVALATGTVDMTWEEEAAAVSLAIADRERTMKEKTSLLLRDEEEELDGETEVVEAVVVTVTTRPTSAFALITAKRPGWWNMIQQSKLDTRTLTTMLTTTTRVIKRIMGTIRLIRAIAAEDLMEQVGEEDVEVASTDLSILHLLWSTTRPIHALPQKNQFLRDLSKKGLLRPTELEMGLLMCTRRRLSTQHLADEATAFEEEVEAEDVVVDIFQGELRWST
jgi:hypothetical protein